MSKEKLLKIAESLPYNTQVTKSFLDDLKTHTRRIIKQEILYYSVGEIVIFATI